MAKSKHAKLNFTHLALLTCLIILVLGSIIGIRKYLSRITQPIKIAEITSAGTINLFFDPPTISTQIGSTNDLNLKISVEGTSRATGVTVDLIYDPSHIQIISVERGDFFTEELVEATVLSEGVSFTYKTPDSEEGKSGSGTVAIVKVKTLKTGTSSIGFKNTTRASIFGSTENALKSNTALSIATQIRSDIFPPTGGDGAINLLDYNELATQFGTSGSVGFNPADLHQDGVVNLLDYNVLATDFNKID